MTGYDWARILGAICYVIGFILMALWVLHWFLS